VQGGRKPASYRRGCVRHVGGVRARIPARSSRSAAARARTARIVGSSHSLLDHRGRFRVRFDRPWTGGFVLRRAERDGSRRSCDQRADRPGVALGAPRRRVALPPASTEPGCRSGCLMCLYDKEDTLMIDVRPEVLAFLERFSAVGTSLDVAAQRECWTETFLSLVPRLVMPVERAAMLAALPRRREMFASIGATASELVDAQESPLDDRHTIVRTAWRWRLQPADGVADELLMKSTFLLRL